PGSTANHSAIHRKLRMASRRVIGLLSKLHPAAHYDVWRRGSNAGCPSANAGEAAERQRAIGVEDGIGLSELRLLEGQVVEVHAKRKPDAFTGVPALAQRDLHPVQSGRLEGFPSQRPGRE